MDKLKISLPIIVEGRYDKIKLTSLVDGNIITTDGFAIFNDKEKLSLLRRMAKDGVILLCDPDGGGAQIRRFLSGALPSDRIYHLHIPAIPGKERRKRTAGRAGTLGVEGVDNEILRTLLAPFSGDAPPARAALTKADLYADGLSGGDGSADRRAAVAERLSLPKNLTPNAFLAAVNLLCSEEEYRAALCEVTA